MSKWKEQLTLWKVYMDGVNKGFNEVINNLEQLLEVFIIVDRRNTFPIKKFNSIHNDDTGAHCPICHSEIKIGLLQENTLQTLYCGQCNWDVQWKLDKESGGYIKQEE